MALLDRLRRDPEQTKALDKQTKRAQSVPDHGPETAYQELKSGVHNRLFELIDLSKLGKVSEERVRQDIALATRRILDEQRVLLTLEERERVVTEIQDEVFGLGPLEPLLQDPTVSDVLVNGHGQIYVELSQVVHTWFGSEAPAVAEQSSGALARVRGIFRRS